MIMDKDVLIKLAYKLANYKEYKKAIVELENEIMYNSNKDTSDLVKTYKVSKVVEDTAIRLADNKGLNYFKGWVDTIDTLQENLLKTDHIKLKIIRLKYIDTDKKVSDNKVIETITLGGYPLSKDLYYTLKEQIFYKLEKMALDKGLKI